MKNKLTKIKNFLIKLICFKTIKTTILDENHEHMCYFSKKIEDLVYKRFCINHVRHE